MSDKFIFLLFLVISNILTGQNPFKAYNLFNENKFEEAIQEYRLLIPIAQSLNGFYDTTILIHYYENIAVSYKETNNIDSCIYYERKIVEIAEHHKLFNLDYYQFKALIYSNSLFKLGKTDDAYSTISDIYYRYYNEIPDSVKIFYLSFKRDYLEELGKIIEIRDLLEEKENIIRRNINSSWIKYEVEIERLATNYFFIDDFVKAENLYKEAILIAQNNFGEKDYRAGDFYMKGVNFYLNLGHLDKADELLEFAKNCLSPYDNNSSLFFDYLGTMGRFYEIKGDLNMSLKFYQDYIEFKLNSNDYSNLSAIYNNIGLLYIKLNDLKRAEYYFLQSVGGEDHKIVKNYSYATFCNNMGIVMFRLGQIQNSKILYSNGIHILEEIGQIKSKIYFTLINNLSQVYVKQDSLNIAVNLLNMNLNNIDTTNRRFKEDYGLTLFTLSGIAHKTKQFNISLEVLEKFNKIMVNIYGESHPYLTEYQLNKANVYELLNNHVKSDSLLFEGMITLKRAYEESILYLAEGINQQFLSQKADLLSAIKSYFLRRPDILRQSEDLYNCELLQKKFLLSSSLRMRKRLINDCTGDCIYYFNEWIKNKKYLANEYSKPIKYRSKKLYETGFETIELENRLLRMSNSFVQNRKFESTSWQDVYINLKPNQVAIEFTSFQYRSPTSWTDSIIYVALILRPDELYPQMVTLFEQRQLDSLLVRTHDREFSQVNNLYRKKRLYDLIWKPIEKFVKPGDQIYFSPTGSLHQINLGALTQNDTVYLSDHYSFYQVGSTAILASDKIADKPIKNIVIFGGIDFDAKDEDISLSINEIEFDERMVSRPIFIQDSTRGGKWTYLKGTMVEAKNICHIAESKNIPSQLYSGVNALEERYKSLNGENTPSILHIATHGFFFPDPKISKEKLDRLAFHTDNPFTIADNPMHRSGLLFSGSNKAWEGDSISLDREDGILTAYEASHTYLKNTELVVLSACETGIGDIKGSEGVYGLQRAFKMAGARYLMMSLWKVPDNATQEFMTSFYTELLTNKKSIRDAYNTTQKHMRDKYRHEPYKWAGFVLVE
jgi:CHAT domain-containing protein/tetratricopeptide (TPR) repeat protein